MQAKHPGTAGSVRVKPTPGGTPVLFDSTWSVAFRNAMGTCGTNAETERTTGTGQLVPGHGYLLLTNSSYNGAVATDGSYSLGLTDSGSLVLRHAGTLVDALCFQFDAATLTALTTCSPAYVCEGAPLLNPHNNTTTSNQDTGLARRSGNLDTQDNSADFLVTAQSNPRNRYSVSAP